jgi:hypothetical protein
MSVNLATVSRVAKIEDKLDTFANLTHVSALKDYFLPKIESFTLKIDEF